MCYPLNMVLVHMRNKRWIKENLTLQNLKFLASKPDPITMFSFCYEHLFSTMVLGSGAGLGIIECSYNGILQSEVGRFEIMLSDMRKRLVLAFPTLQGFP